MKNRMLVQSLKHQGHVALAAAAILASTLISSSRAADGIDAIRVATGFSYPLYVCAPPGDTSRLFVAEQHGLIKIINLPSRRSMRPHFSIFPSKSDKARAAEFSA